LAYFLFVVPFLPFLFEIYYASRSSNSKFPLLYDPDLNPPLFWILAGCLLLLFYYLLFGFLSGIIEDFAPGALFLNMNSLPSKFGYSLLSPSSLSE
jgi:hypothetical protein